MIQDQIDTVEIGLTGLQGDLTNLYDNQTFDRFALELRIKLLSSVVSWLNECHEVFKSRKPTVEVYE